jgi:hypothetical protein
VRFRLPRGTPDRFGALPGVTAIQADGEHITLQTANSDATIWALYNLRDAIAGLEITSGSLQEAFLALTR